MEAVAVLVLFVAGCVIVLRGFAFLIGRANAATPPYGKRGNSDAVASPDERAVFARRD